jgi:predicted ATPase/class 3 adenylate cyclase
VSHDSADVNELPTGTVTFLFTDIEGSTRLLDELGAEHYSEALTEHRRLVRAAISAHGGAEVDTEGDAFFCTFAQALDAVLAAASAQRALAEGPIRIRIGIHTGEALVVGKGYVGIDIHRAARVMAAGHGGQVLVSGPTRELLPDSAIDGISLADLGLHRLKDLREPEALYQLVLEGLPFEFPALKTLDNRPTNLPVQPTPFVGREQELEEAQALLALEDVRLLTLTGPGGTGKTRLALQLAAELVEQFKHGVYAVSLAPISDPDLVPSTIAQTLHLREQPGEPIEETLSGYLEQKEMLVLLDNFEQVLPAAPSLAKLLRRAPKLKLLVTSRAPLHLSHEREYAVLPLPGADAVTLFVERAKSVKREFELTEANEQAVREICARLDGLPLALELAAARVRMLPPAALLERLEERLPLLTGGARDLDERQQTLRSTIEWSYELLSEQEQTLFARLSVFVSGCTLEAAEAVCGADFDTLESLVEQNLVRQREDAQGEPRFSMLETIREYALARLDTSGEDEELRRAHADYFVALAEKAEPRLIGKDQLEWTRRLDAELDNLRSSLAWLVEHRDADSAIREVAALWWFWDLRGYVPAGREATSAVLSIADAAAPELRARALARAGNLALCAGELDEALLLTEQAAAIARAIGSDRDSILACYTLAWIELLRGAPAKGVEYANQAATLARSVAARWELALALTVLAWATSDLGNLKGAEEMLRESLSLSQELEDDRGVSMSLGSLGTTAMLSGDYIRAIELSEEASTLLRRLDDPRFLANTLTVIGIASLYTAEWDRAADALEEGVGLSARGSDRSTAADQLRAAAALAARAGFAQRAGVTWGAAEEILRSMRAEAGPATRALDAWIAKAETALGSERFELARREGRALSFDDALEYAVATLKEARNGAG